MSKTQQSYDNDSLEITVGDSTYTVEVHAKGMFYYSPATRVDPEDSELDIGEVEATWTDENGNVVEATEEMSTALEDYLQYEAEWEDDEPEPPEDYYEERAMARWEARLDRYGL